jgi:diaminopropionate ammonia-lyase
MTVRWYAHDRDRQWTCTGPAPQARAFHRTLDGYTVTPLAGLPSLAEELGVGHVLVKDESSRLGLPAFKALGASWAIHRALRDLDGDSHRPVTIVTATDGNHGRAVARFSRLLEHPALIVVPEGVHPAAVQAIRDEGAQIEVIAGSYDEAVAAAARAAEADGALLVQDTSWDGYEEIPGWIVEGYSTLFAEVDEQLDEAGLGAPDLVVVPVGVGSLLQAALAHYRRADGGPAVLSAEPVAAACVAPSLAAGHPVSVETGSTIMAGLNCGTPSTLAWAYIQHGLDAAVSVTDAEDVRAARDLAALGVPAGPCGAAALAALRVALQGDGADDRRRHLRLRPDAVVVLIATEGVGANPLPPSSTDGEVSS